MKKILLLMIFFSFLGMIFPPHQSAQQKAEEAVKATLISMWTAIEENDVEKYSSYIHPEFTSFGEFDVYIKSGKELEVRSVAQWLKKAKNVHTDMHQPEVKIIDRVAWITYYWTDYGEEDGKRFSSRGKSTRIFTKENGKWLCIHAHHTAVP